MNLNQQLRQYLSNPEATVNKEWVDEMMKQYPYFILPALLYQKRSGTDNNLMARIAISHPDRKSLYCLLGENADVFAKFYPDEQKPLTPTTENTIDTFLNTFGTTSEKELEVLNNLISNPVPDYADILAAEDANEGTLPSEGESAQDALINSFIAREREKEQQVGALPQQHVDSEEIAEIANTPIAQPTEHDPSMLSESLAKMYIQRRNYAKALEIIENINLNFPEKSIYFADQIRFLRKLVLNEQTKK